MKKYTYILTVPTCVDYVDGKRVYDYHILVVDFSKSSETTISSSKVIAYWNYTKQRME